LSDKFIIKKNSHLYKVLREIDEGKIKDFMNAIDDNVHEHSDERKAAILERIIKQYEDDKQ